MAEAAAAPIGARPSSSWAAFAALGAGLAALLVLYWPTAASAIDQWRSSSAYSYGYLILPISLFLIWRDRDRFGQEEVRPNALGVVILAGFAFLWLAGDFLWIAEGRQIALMGMVQGLLLAVLGWRAYKSLLFPFLYLWLMVPSGTFLLPPLQHISHQGAAWLVDVSGIPVYAEGNLIQVPEGHFIVEPGCAGLNFFLTALALSLLFGKLNYRSLRARLLCVAIALGLSVIANILRIYLIIVLTQITHRKFDIADDHLLYGWGFFGVVMLVTMWVGARFANPEEPAPKNGREMAGQQPVLKFAAAAGAAIVLAAIPPAFARATAPAAAAPVAAFSMPQAIGSWNKLSTTVTAWRPLVSAGASFGEAAYTANGVEADVAIAAYPVQANGEEAAAGDNQPVAPPWETAQPSPTAITVDGHEVAATSARYGESSRLLLYWYESAGCITMSRLRAKLCAAVNRLRARPAPGAFIVLSIAPTTEPGASEAVLAQLAGSLLRQRVAVQSNPME